MARIATDPNYSSPTFPRATAGTDLFLKEDVQALAAAVSTHDHSTGKGVALTAGAIPNGTITSAMIADGTIDSADLKDSSVTSAKILDGTIATVDLANAAVTNAKLASDTDRTQLLTNGRFEVWQRGNGPFTAAFCTDRWAIYVAGTDTISVSKDTTNKDIGSQACAACTFVLGTGGGTSGVYQQLKTSDNPGLAGRTVSVSIRIRTATASAIRVALTSDGTGGTTVNSATHTGGGTYQTLTAASLVVPADATFVQVNCQFLASCTAYLDNAMLVVGSVAADYAPLHPADDLARCLRYYEAIGLSAGNDVLVGGYGAAGTIWWTPFQYRAPKPVTPTLTKNGTWGVTNCAQPGVVTNTTHGFGIQTGVTATGAFNYQNNAVGTNFTAEANP